MKAYWNYRGCWWFRVRSERTQAPDAEHIAAAAVEECEFLLTWNFRHIANVPIRREVERIRSDHSYTRTTICTPEELI
jgi:hypothetical protein